MLRTATVALKHKRKIPACDSANMKQQSNKNSPAAYELVANSNDKDLMDELSTSFTEEMHFRSSMLTASRAMHLADDRAPIAQEGMLRRIESAAIDASIDAAAAYSSSTSTSLPYQKKQQQQQQQQQQKHPHSPKSGVYLEAERDVIRRTLEEVDKVAAKRIRDGFSEVNFTIGVLNMILVSFVFALYPEHFWLLFLVEGLVFVSTKALVFWQSRPLNNILYMLDYCWIMNILALFVLLFFLVDAWLLNPIGERWHKQVFMSSLGTACGPLLGACYILPFVCCLFHSMETLSDLFIHIFPPMVAYTLRWHPSEVAEHWPNIFILDYAEEVIFFPLSTSSFGGSVVGSTIILYLVWFVLYSTWMLAVGMDLPRSDMIKANGQMIVPKYDTVFHSLMRGGLYIVTGSKFFGRSKALSVEHMNANNFDRGDLFVYLGAHLFLSVLSTVLLGYPCFHSKRLHGFLLALVTVVVVYRGALRYTYYATEMYGKTLRKQFAHLLDED